mmetsp:Transcript_6815/g.21881  ORF Transcript_6815/g.21881 Transcript_6815/m.21881 type:complete len:263 (+) Transcript_6815:328-1116(+)
MTQFGVRSLWRHLMLKNFSMPMSAPKPASVTQKPSSPARLRATWSAMMDELPCAMLANGPQCTRTGVCSTVCIRVGMIASHKRTAAAPATPRSSAVTGSPSRESATTIRPSRSRMSCSADFSSEWRHKAMIAMISEATEMSKPVRRGLPFASVAARPISISRRERSQVSRTRFQVMVSGSMSSRAKRSISSSVSSFGSVLSMPSLARRLSMGGAKLRFPSFSGQRRRKRAAVDCVCSWNMRVSIAAATRLLAAEIAWISPVR